VKNFTTHFRRPRLILGLIAMLLLDMAGAQATPLQAGSAGAQPLAPAAVLVQAQGVTVRVAWDRVGAPVNGIQTTV